MGALELRFLGEFEVLRDGKALSLPPSKKTRALLAYLALHDRQFRREHLCELLWEIPDDPRGSLRWSLSKLRRLIDDDERKRIIADRTNVGVDTGDVSIDVTDLHAVVGNGIEDASVEELEAAASRYRGNFLEGLEFSNFHDFHAWCVAEREQALHDRAALLDELVRRLETQPEAAIPYARALVGIKPYDEAPRVRLIRLLIAAKHTAEVEQQYQLGMRMLKEAGVVPSPALHAARRAPQMEAKDSAPAVSTPGPAVTIRRSNLLGRDDEIALIADTLTEVIAERRPEALLLRGAPGIGKTRVLLAAAALAQQHEALLLHTAAFESESLRPFAMWIDSMRGLDGDEADTIFGASDDSNRDRLFADLNDYIAIQAADRPVVVIFDDMHWCDESSAAVLHYVTRMNRNSPVLAVLAARSGELRDNAPVQQSLRGMRREGLLREVPLGPLDEAAMVELIDTQAPGANGERLSRECGGNPLLAIELARAEIAGSGGGSLDELVRERLMQFDVTGGEALRWAAVLGRRVDPAVLGRVTGLADDEIGAILEAAERRALLMPTSRGLRFSHSLIEKAIYTDISPIRRQVMHRRIAELLERDAAMDLTGASNLAHHATQSGDAGLAARAMVSAGRLCLRFFANDDALSLARQGLNYADQLPDADRVCVQIDLHDVLLSAGPLDDWEVAATLYAALAEEALDHNELAHARLGYHMASYVRWVHGHWTGAREHTLQAERAIRGTNDESHVVGMAETAKCLLLLERDLSQADAMLMEAGSLAKRWRVSHHAIPFATAMLRFHEGRLDEAEELFQESRTLCKSAGDRLSEYQANEYLAMIDVQRGNFAEAKARCAELLSLGHKLREGSEGPFANALDALCTYALDDDLAVLDAPVEALRLVDAKHRLAYILTRAALIDVERDRPDVALSRAEEALGCAEILDRATEMLLAHAVLANGYRHAGNDDRAAAHAAEAKRLESAGAAGWAVDIADVLKH